MPVYQLGPFPAALPCAVSAPWEMVLGRKCAFSGGTGFSSWLLQDEVLGEVSVFSSVIWEGEEGLVLWVSFCAR